jgi:hypothetical protein
LKNKIKKKTKIQQNNAKIISRKLKFMSFINS